MSFFTSFQELLDFDQSTNLNGFHFSNSLFGFDSNSIPTLENLPPPAVLVDQPAAIASTRLKTPSPIPEPTPVLETPKQCQTIQPLQQQQQQQSPVQPPAQQQTNSQQVSPIPIVSKFQLKVTPNNEIYISNESGTFCELAGSFVPSTTTVERKSFAVPIVEIIPPASPEVIEPDEPEPPKTLFCIERGIKRPLSPTDQRYCNSGIFRSLEAQSSPLKKKTTSTASNGHCTGGPDQESAAKLVVSNVINNGLIVNKKHLSNNEEQPKASTSATPERRIMRTKKKKRKAAPKTTLEAKVEPVNGKITTRITSGPTITSRKVPQQQQTVGKRPTQVQDNLRKVPIKPLATATAASASSPTAATTESTLNFSGIKEKAAQEAIFIERVEKQPSLQMQPPQQQQQQPLSPKQQQQQSQQKIVSTKCVSIVVEPDTKLAPEGAAIPDEAASSGPAPVELKVVADLVMDKEVFGHISLLSNGHDRSKAVIYQNPVTTKNVIYSILNPKSLNLNLGGCGRGTTATLTLEPHRRKPKKRGRKKKVPGENPTTAPEVNANGLNSLLTPIPPDLSAIDPNVPVMITRSGRLSKPPRYANNFFQNIKQKTDQPTLLPPPPPPPPVLPRIDLPATDPETIEKLPNFSAALTSTVAPHPEPEPKRKMNIPLQYRCATCNKIYLGKRMQRHLEKYPSHNSQRDCMDKGKEKIEKEEEEKSTYLYRHLFDLLQKFTEKDKGRVMLKEISNFVDYVRALIPKLITNDEQNSTVEYIDHNVADVLRLNHGKYRLKLSSLAEEYDKLNLTVNLLNNNNSSNHGLSTPSRPPPPPLSTSTPNGTTERHSLSFNADDLLNQSSSFPSLTTLMHEHNLLLQQNGTVVGACNNIINNNNNSFHQQNNNHQHQQSNHNHHHPHHLNHHHHHHYSNHHHHLPLIGSSCHDDAMNSLSGLCKSPVQHSTSGMVNMALNLY